MAYLTLPSLAAAALLVFALPGALVAQTSDAATAHRPLPNASPGSAVAAPGSGPVSSSKPKEVVVVGREIKPPAAAAPSPSLAGRGARGSARHSLPEVDDEVLVALQSGDYRTSGKYVVVSVSHGKTITLGDGAYRTRSGRRFNIRNARLLTGE